MSEQKRVPRRDQSLRKTKLETLLAEKSQHFETDGVDELGDFEKLVPKGITKADVHRKSIIDAAYTEKQEAGAEVEVRLKDYSYSVPVKMDAPTIPTFLNQSVCYGAFEVFRRIHRYCKNKGKQALDPRASWRPRTASDVVLPFQKKPILKGIDLVLEPSKVYLILGPPGCGKTSLLKAIAGRLPHYQTPKGKPMKGRPFKNGRVEYNGVAAEDDRKLVLPNVVSYVGQLDDHAPYLTVRETFDFAHRCRTGGQEHRNTTAKENLTIEGLDLAQCADTFVGDANVRGISGGQRRRVTVGEMMQGDHPVACADEISTGLDAAVTHSIIYSIVAFAKAAKTTRVIALLQPGPETFSLFDEVILLAEGMLVYAGPISEVVSYFERLGYKQPATMDVADFLQSIPTPDGEIFFDAAAGEYEKHSTAGELAAAFRESEQHKRILRKMEKPCSQSWIQDGQANVPDEFKTRFQNSWYGSFVVNLKRHLTLWKRNIGFIIGKTAENAGMAVTTGGILFGQGKLPDGFDFETMNWADAEAFRKQNSAVFAALFMTTLHILLGTSTSAPDEIDGRSIHYKHYDASFYQIYSFLIGRLVSTIPQRTIEICAFGIPLYWMVGLNPTAGSFFTYLLLLIFYTVGLKMLFGIFAQILRKKANVLGLGTFVVLLFSLFGGFIVHPITIPRFYYFIYWTNPMTWCLQGLLSNEYMSDRYPGSSASKYLAAVGFKTGRAWIGYSFAFMIPFVLLSTVVLGLVLKYVRIEPDKSRFIKSSNVTIGEIAEERSENNIPFTPVNLTFEKLIYEVKASTGNETLRLLNEISGAFLAGRMCALMGSSGAGKTTLMDVLALRKTSGTITGDIRLNGFPQERTSFLRCSGYVEQFDVQQPELTVRETVEFCARLRLDARDPAIKSDEGKLQYADGVLAIMELNDIQNLQVGSFEEGGLTFEQRKRLAIACELAGSPSLLFLDEPTSGLDSRGALVVMRAARRIADTGRTVCATIHQPSAAVFELFDDLLLLMRGGNVVFFGELGSGSAQLVDYFESHGANPIQYGENPAAWMLSAFSGKDNEEAHNWPELFKSSEQHRKLCQLIEECAANTDESKKIVFDEIFATTTAERFHQITVRINRIYKRSPAYNLARLMIATFYSFILGSIFFQQGGYRNAWSEFEIEAVLGTMFFGLIIIGVISISMAIPVTKTIRDVFYKHRASGMMSHHSLSWALFFAETPYLCTISLIFGIIYYSSVGLFSTIERFFLFWVFFLLNVAIYSYFGQAFICLVKDIPTAGALVGALVGFNIFFSGFIVKPQFFVGAFQIGFWVSPGRYAYEGLVVTQFNNVDAPVIPSTNSSYYVFRNCTVESSECVGTVSDYVDFYFGGKFDLDNFWLDWAVLMCYMCISKLACDFALGKFNYTNS